MSAFYLGEDLSHKRISSPFSAVAFMPKGLSSGNPESFAQLEKAKAERTHNTALHLLKKTTVFMINVFY